MPFPCPRRPIDTLTFATGPELILSGVYDALKPGGRFVGEIGADGNMETFRMACYDFLREQGVDATPYDPYFFPTSSEFGAMLEAAGFEVPLAPVRPSLYWWVRGGGGGGLSIRVCNERQ